MTQEEIVGEVERLAASGATRDEVLRGTVAILKEERQKYNWVGIYLLDGSYLVLHNYIGKPTDHVRIPVGRGVCGAAVADQENKIVEDVAAEDNYLACSLETRSEIVVLIRKNGQIFGQIDIDSDEVRAFNNDDEALLSKVTDILADLF